MRQAIQGGPRQSLAEQHLVPWLEGQVRRHDHACPFIGLSDHLEEQFTPLLAGGNVAQFVDDEDREERVPGASPARLKS